MPVSYIVRNGDCLSKIAKRHGFNDYRAIYDHPDNAELRKHRPSPDVLFPGDVVVIPEKEDKNVDAATGKTHRFVVRQPKKVLRVQLLRPDAKPLAGEPYVLRVAGRDPVEGATDGDGVVEQDVLLDDASATLEIAGRELTLDLGGLNPIKQTPDDGATGAQARLKNLGFGVGPIDGKIGRRSRGALTMFQSEHGLPITGKPDAATLAKLEEEHGC